MVEWTEHCGACTLDGYYCIPHCVMCSGVYISVVINPRRLCRGRDPLAAMCVSMRVPRGRARAGPLLQTAYVPSRPLLESAPRDGRVSCAALSRPACN